MKSTKSKIVLVIIGFIILSAFLYKPLSIRYYIWKYKQATLPSSYTKLSDFGEDIIEPINDELTSLADTEYSGAFRQLAFQSLLRLRYENLAEEKGTHFIDSVRTARLPLNDRIINVMAEAYRQEKDSTLLVAMTSNLWEVDYEFYYTTATQLILQKDKSLSRFLFIPSVFEPEKHSQELEYWQKTVAPALRERLQAGLNPNEDVANNYRVYLSYSTALKNLLQADFNNSWEIVIDFMFKNPEGKFIFLGVLELKTLRTEAKKHGKLDEVNQLLLEKMQEHNVGEEVLERLDFVSNDELVESF